MIQEGKLTVKEQQIDFVFNQQVSAYQSQLTILNLSQRPIYFKIVSTFGKLLTIENHTHKKIQPSKSLIFNLKLKIPNQIKQNSQFMRISYSNKQISSKFKFFDDPFFDVKINFDQSVPQEDQMITQILKDDCDQLCADAAQFLKNGLVKRALDKYEESFLLYRQHGQGLYGMSECQYLMQQWQQAIDTIETALLMLEQQKFIWLKLKISFQIYKDEPRNLQLVRKLKQAIEKLADVFQHKQKKKEMLDYLAKQEQKLLKQKGGKLLAQFIQKALQKYQTEQFPKDNYKTYQQYEQEMLQVLGLKKPHAIEQTPEYVLDPIYYQIMKDPVIVPSGHSYQPKSLLVYLAKHGNKDLYTRQQLRYEWSRPNNALKNYIQTNSHLKQWTQYEKEISTFK